MRIDVPTEISNRRRLPQRSGGVSLTAWRKSAYLLPQGTAGEKAADLSTSGHRISIIRN
jgi:hypothetical protein